MATTMKRRKMMTTTNAAAKYSKGSRVRIRNHTMGCLMAGRIVRVAADEFGPLYYVDSVAGIGGGASVETLGTGFIGGAPDQIWGPYREEDLLPTGADYVTLTRAPSGAPQRGIAPGVRTCE